MNKQDALLYRILRPIITVLFKVLFTPKIEGKENIGDDRLVLAGNHTSIMDCLLLISSTKRSIHFLAKKELWKGPKKILFSNMGLIPVDRSIKDKKPLEASYKYLDNEAIVLVFPEGTTEKGRGLMDFKIGAVKMAYEKNSEIVPFVIKGKYRLFSRKLTLKFLNPIKISDDLDKENIRLRNLIKEELEG